MAVVVVECVLDEECSMDELAEGEIALLGAPAGAPVLPLLQPAASTSTAAAEIEKRTKRLFIGEPFVMCANCAEREKARK
jgi:hypothetical protein